MDEGEGQTQDLGPGVALTRRGMGRVWEKEACMRWPAGHCVESAGSGRGVEQAAGLLEEGEVDNELAVGFRLCLCRRYGPRRRGVYERVVPCV